MLHTHLTNSSFSFYGLEMPCLTLLNIEFHDLLTNS